MQTRYDPLIAALREAAQPERRAPPPLEPYLEQVRLHAYKIVDGNVAELKSSGFSEDEIFEHTVSAAVAAGADRLDAALRVLE